VNPTQVLTAAANLLLIEELQRLLARFNEQGITVFLLKGIALLLDEYRDGYHLRRMGDTDILVAPEQVEAAQRALEGLGYSFYANRGLVYERRGRNTYLVDLHSELDHLPPAELAAVLDRSRLVEVAGHHARVLAPDDNFLYIACHMGLHHAYITPNGLADLDRLARRHSLDYRAIASAAGRCGVEAPVGEVLRILLRRHSTPLPAAFLDALAPRGRGRVAARFYRKILTRNRCNHGWGVLLQILFHGTPRQRLLQLWRYLFLERESMRRRYALDCDRAAWHHYLLRPLGLVRRLASITRGLQRGPIW